MIAIPLRFVARVLNTRDSRSRVLRGAPWFWSDGLYKNHLSVFGPVAEPGLEIGRDGTEAMLYLGEDEVCPAAGYCPNLESKSFSFQIRGLAS